MSNGSVDNNIPEHISIIMDGNGRWAQRNSLPRIAGHKEGISSVRAITKKCDEIGVKNITQNDKIIGSWITSQRTKNRKGKLDKKKVKLLVKAGLKLNPNKK